LTFCRYGRATWSSLAASLAIHGVALGGLVLSAGERSPRLFRGEGASGAAASGGVVMVRLLQESALPGQAVARAQVSTPEARTPSIELLPDGRTAPPERAETGRDSTRPAPATGSRDRLPAPVQRPAATPLQTESFAAAAVAAVRGARFHPAMRGGQQVPSRVALRLHFRLER
jgi:hypothetical protein